MTDKPVMWTREQILVALGALAQIRRRTPTQRWTQAHGPAGLVSAATREFGTWNKAVVAAGLAVNLTQPLGRGRYWTADRVLDTIRALADDLGRTPSSQAVVAAGYAGMLPPAYEHFGSWPAACEAAGLASAPQQHLERLRERAQANLGLRRAEAIRVLQAWAADLGRTPTVKMAKRAGAPISAAAVECRFGSWNKGIEAAGLAVTPHGGRPQALTAEQVIDALQEWAVELGRAPTGTEAHRAGAPVSANVAEARFGTWNKALEAACLTPTAVREHDRESVIALLQQWTAALGRVPTSTEADRRGSLVSLSTVKKHFGSWAAGIEAAGLPVQRRGARAARKDPDKARRVQRLNYARDQQEAIIGALREWAQHNERSPRPGDATGDTGLPSVGAVSRWFGGWGEALAAADLPPYDHPTADRGLRNVARTPYMTPAARAAARAELEHRRQAA